MAKNKKKAKKKVKDYEKQLKHEKAIAKQWELDEELAMKKAYPEYEINFDPEGIEGLVGMDELKKYKEEKEDE